MDRTRSRWLGFMVAFALLLPGSAFAECEADCYSLSGHDYCAAYGPEAFCCCTASGGAFCTDQPVPWYPCDWSLAPSDELASTDQFLKSLGSQDEARPVLVVPGPRSVK